MYFKMLTRSLSIYGQTMAKCEKCYWGEATIKILEKYPGSEIQYKQTHLCWWCFQNRSENLDH